jgi:hypothetical protein
MKLQRGITGFLGRKDPPPEQAGCDLKAFRSDCHTAARTVGARLLSVQDRNEASGACNYAIAGFEFSDSVIAVLLNRVYPVITLVSSPTGSQITFE